MGTASSILLVEDDLDIRESLQEALEDHGYAVASAIDGIDALERLRAAAELPNIILLDMMMPRMNGLQFHAELRKVPAWSAIPVVLVTADAHARTKARELSAAGCLKKPVKLGELLDVVASVLDGSVA